MTVDKDMNILIVDDMKSMLQIIESVLNQLGFRKIDKAVHGEQALSKLKEKKYDLVLSDWNMEPMSGLDLLKNIRANAAMKTLPVILITAESKPENILAAKQAGVNNYIVKPFTATTLREKMSAVIGNF